MLPFYTPTIVKLLGIVGLSVFFSLLCLQARFGRDRDKCCKIEDVTIPFNHSIIVPTKNAKLLTHLFMGIVKFGRDRDN